MSFFMRWVFVSVIYTINRAYLMPGMSLLMGQKSSTASSFERSQGQG
jgi:hypothetical protein